MNEEHKVKLYMGCLYLFYYNLLIVIPHILTAVIQNVDSLGHICFRLSRLSFDLFEDGQHLLHITSKDQSIIAVYGRSILNSLSICCFMLAKAS